MPGPSGPFTIDGFQYRTDATGLIQRVIAAVPERIETPPTERFIRIRDKKEQERRDCQQQVDELLLDISRFTAEIADMDEIIANARPGRP